MRRGLIAFVLAITVVCGLQMISATPANACTQDLETNECIRVDATDPGSGGSTADPGTSGGTAGERQCQFQGKRIDCTNDSGTWSVQYLCYLNQLDPQPPRSDPRWDGHTNGAVYACFNPYIPGMPGVQTTIWLEQAPDEIDLVQLARHAIDTMHLRAIRIGLSVPDQPDRMIYVGAPVWMWTADPDQHTTGPNQATATAGAITVTARAVLTGIDWTMGEKPTTTSTIHCTGQHRATGTPYKPAYGLTDSPTCGYRYQHPHQHVTITATSHWNITWTGAGETGTLPINLTRTTTRPVGEIQALITNH